ncbi:MAG: 1-acyl-sn-glycerol-3-phosphate acyltransferase [Xanthobacteraceae bacterium]|nr:1-acyl-sn-glycerol-3-phosphate acyltransferase [Xanthobacteraceae bacterium]MBX3535262.1 1-acyl-sn-glycerol-3-phosphate acyltransferase [Xanthobacteraceae bacterium]MCW5674054.1 1-acyl-sn-glycerol-3-phosphate acyltransferase [Xanthobacteraceae bacterium]MCW5678134.1 1-acyl-sn-glycerol-3-phosphate acyltransferase [Xanthobacteraceae bacterium]
MWSEVALPLWLVIIISCLAALAFLDRLLLPSVRWALRRRANKAIGELNTRLRLQIKPFKLTKRQVLMDRLVYDPEVLHAIDETAREQKIPREVLLQKVKRYAGEIVPSFSAYAYFRIGTRIAKRISETLYRVRIGFRNEEAFAKVDPDSSVVFVINHRSNMDYVLVTYVAAQSSALSYAVGEWAQIWGLRNLIRSMGAYFIRRDSRDALYRKVLSRYVHMATASGVVQAIFPEGGLSRDGKLRPPKFGLLSYMVAAFDPKGPKDVVFVPVGVNYDRVLEDRMLTSAANTEPGKRPVFGFNLFTFLRHFFRHVWMAMRGEWYRYGYTCVSFGDPLSLKQYVSERKIDFRDLPDEQRHAEIERLGAKLMDAVGKVVPALPVSLVATALLDAHPAPLSLFDIKARVSKLIETLEASKAYVHIPRADRDYAIEVGLRMLTLRHIVKEADGIYSANPADLHILRYYANAIAHLLPGVSAAGEIAQPEAAVPSSPQVGAVPAE